jgi:hypothetical protein
MIIELDQGREGVEGRLGNHPASPTGASRQALNSPDAHGDRVQAHSCKAPDMFVVYILRAYSHLDG